MLERTDVDGLVELSESVVEYLCLVAIWHQPLDRLLQSTVESHTVNACSTHARVPAAARRSFAVAGPRVWNSLPVPAAICPALDLQLMGDH